jgi:hypothetical protein
MSVDSRNSHIPRAPAPIIHHTYRLDGADPAQLDKRLSRLERALALRGGRLTSVKRRTQRDGQQHAIVHYEVPAMPSASGEPGA